MNGKESELDHEIERLSAIVAVLIFKSKELLDALALDHVGAETEVENAMQSLADEVREYEGGPEC